MSKYCKELEPEECAMFPEYCMLYANDTKCRKKQKADNIPLDEYFKVTGKESEDLIRIFMKLKPKPKTQKEKVKIIETPTIYNISPRKTQQELEEEKELLTKISVKYLDIKPKKSVKVIPVLITKEQSETSKLILDILNNPAFKTRYAILINKLSTQSLEDKERAIELYQLITSDNFKNLIINLHFDSYNIEKIREICETINFKSSPNMLYFAEQLIEFVNSGLNTSNTDYIYKTRENVQSTEDIIPNLEISSFKSISNIFTNFKVYPKVSVSSSIILTGNLNIPADKLNAVKNNKTIINGSKFYFKLFPIVEQNLSLVSELNIYNELFKLVKYNITPNILCKVAGNDALPDLLKFVVSQASKEFFNDFRKYMSKVNEAIGLRPGQVWERTGVIITHPGGSTLSEKLRGSSPLTTEELRQVMFQIIYTLYVFDKLEISHADLHLNNLFIIDIPPTEFNFIVDEIRYKFTTTKLVKIFDFDRGMIMKTTELIINKTQKVSINRVENPDRLPGKSNNDEFGETYNYNKNLDFSILTLGKSSGFLVLSSDNLYFNIFGDKNPEFDKFIKDVIPGCNFNNPISRVGVKETYDSILNNPKNKQLLQKVNEFYNLPSNDSYNFMNYDINSFIASTNWLNYFRTISSYYGRLIKSHTPYFVENNALWIPKNVILDKIEMIRHPYFSSFALDQSPIDITRDNVFTIDGKL